MEKHRKRIITRSQLFIIGVIVVTILLIIVVLFFNKASVQRDWKTFKSEYTNGIDRTITVYDYNGNVIKTYSGKFDVTESETGIMFDDSETGKRTIIAGGIIINEEN